MADFDTNLELAIDALSTAVEAVNPPKFGAAFPFLRYRGPTPLDELDDSAIRFFCWDTAGELVVTGGPEDAQGPAQDGEGIWYRHDLTLRLKYPRWWMPDGEGAARGPDVLQLADILAINDRLMLQDPLAAVVTVPPFEYFALELLRSFRVSTVRTAIYRARWYEPRHL